MAIKPPDLEVDFIPMSRESRRNLMICIIIVSPIVLAFLPFVFMFWVVFGLSSPAFAACYYSCDHAPLVLQRFARRVFGLGEVGMPKAYEIAAAVFARIHAIKEGVVLAVRNAYEMVFGWA
jgi:hypothetical protein